MALEVNAPQASETSVSSRPKTWRRIPEALNLHRSSHFSFPLGGTILVTSLRANLPACPHPWAVVLLFCACALVSHFVFIPKLEIYNNFCAI
jgi:hypothetical protein